VQPRTARRVTPSQRVFIDASPREARFFLDSRHRDPCPVARLG
jgi:hypothetical protein